MLDARDAVLVRFTQLLSSTNLTQATVRDIEDIVTMGKKSRVCPYYATRRAVKQAQVCSK